MAQSILYGKLADVSTPLGNLPNIFPGMYFILFIRTITVLFRRTIMKTGMYRVMIITAIVMWIVATAVCHPRFITRHQAWGC